VAAAVESAPAAGVAGAGRRYFAAAGNDGSFAISRMSCWMMIVAFRFLAMPLTRSSDATVCARSKLKDGTPVTIRPIRPEDEPLMVRFHETLSPESVYFRYFNQLKIDERIAHERLTRICFNDYDREIALVAELRDPKNKNCSILGVGRLSKARSVNEAEFALLVSDSCQGQGLGGELLNRLVQIGRDEKLDCLTASILADNKAMLNLSKKAGFKIQRNPGGQDFTAEYVF